ncbi:MAG: Sodium-dependent phosphate transporter [uncultured Sulfurovum sp.]|uniref:Sodium-dependent phosphate transporter n=1 Tax=uncultured Sulfurovum sp. TaxID=269237 RepID=A0A6S6UBD8_9BACT|nr:MAG: Sodium-dependent phosphate transporter [uncultured Sulfurovum sp.]
MTTGSYPHLLTPVIILLIAVSLILLGTYPDISTILGGIALFLIGMEYMENGFKTFSGGLLEKVLEKFTNNTPKAITTGFLATAIVQSSSLISIIVISFLSAKLITLTSAVGVIFGSNIGTTTTAWLVSVFGLHIKISVYAMPMLVLGIIIPLFLKSKSWKGIAAILIGLGVIFLGIGYMKEGFETLKEGLDLAKYAMGGYAGIFVYVLVGSVATVIIQSSSATMALIITALATGQIDYANALALAIGANLGTTVTAILGALKSNDNGKRLAVAHLIFNLVTAFIAILFIYQLTYVVDYLSAIVGISSDNYAMKLSLFHTIFNVIGILAVSPFITKLVQFLNTLFISKAPERGKAKYLDESALKLPLTSLLAIIRETKHLYANAFEIITHGLNLKRSNLLSTMPLEEVIKDSYSSSPVDIDNFYKLKIKGIYGEIIDFSAKAQSTMSTEDIEELYKLKLANRDMVEAVKDTKHLQKNLIKYANNTNTHIKAQYDHIRQNLAELLRTIHTVSTTEEEHEILLLLSKAKLHTEKYDILANGTLDNLIRNRLISNEMATSLMNDSTYAYDISTNLITMAEITFTDRSSHMSDLKEEMSMDTEDIKEILDKKDY